MKKINIVGAGFSGLSLAYFLTKFKSYEITIYEKNDRVGGLISTPVSKYGIYETAANGFLNTRLVNDFLDDISANYVGVDKTRNKKYIYNKKPKQWPLNMPQTLYFIIKVFIFLFSKNKKPKINQSLKSWAQYHFGNKVSDYIIAPIFQGIYAADASILSANLVLKRFFIKKNKQKRKIDSTLLSSKLGMGHVMNQLRQYLINQGVIIKENCEWQGESNLNTVTVIATSVKQASLLLETINLENTVYNSNILKEIQMLPLVTVTCFFSERPKNYLGFGILFPKSENFNVLGILMSGVIFNRNEDHYSETWILGGTENVTICKLSDNEITELIKKERKVIFHSDQEILEIKITKWIDALPIYSCDLESNVNKLKPMPGLYLHGNYLGQIGLSQIFERSQILANLINQENSV